MFRPSFGVIVVNSRFGERADPAVLSDSGYDTISMALRGMFGDVYVGQRLADDSALWTRRGDQS